MIICVAARMKSKRCPGKALANLYGKQLILRLFDRLAPTGLKAVLCTSTHKDDRVLADACRMAGIEVYQGSENDVMERFLAVADKHQAANIIRVTGDNPLTDPDMMLKMVEEHLSVNPDYTRAVDMPAGTKCEIVKTEALRSLHDDLKADGTSIDTEYMTYDLQTLPTILEVPGGLDDTLSFTVDYPEQLKAIQAIYEYYKGKPPTLKEIIGAGFGA